MKPDHCTSCPLYEAPGPVFGVGPQRAKFFLVGEAPGQDEVEFGKPFIGGSGRILRSMLKMAGINQYECFITNVVKCRPTRQVGNKTEDRAPTDREIEHCTKFLVQELVSISSEMLVCIGNTALKALTDKDGITKYRGIPFMSGGRKVLATLHPANIMRNWEYFVVPIWDLQRAEAARLAGPEFTPAPVEYSIPARVEFHAADLRSRCRESGFVYFDIESTGLDPRRDQVICLGLGATPFHAQCYAWNDSVAALATELFTDLRLTHVGQNSESFDIGFLAEKGVRFHQRSWDTMLMFHLVNSDLPKDLGFISSFYTDMEPWKDTSGEDLFLYNCKDVDNTARDAVALRKELHQLGMTDLYDKSVAPLQPVLRAMSRRGLRKNEELAELWAMKMTLEAKKQEDQLRQVVGIDFNVASSKDVMKLLYDKMGLPVQYTRDRVRGFRPTADAKAIANLVGMFPENAILSKIADIRSCAHTISTNLRVATDEQGFVHPRFGCAKAANGRLNSWDPNGQNVPYVLREIYIPDTLEHVFIEADWSQVEWRVAMIQSSDPVGLELLCSGRDNHKAVAAEAFGIRYEDVDKALRHTAKFIVYGLGYGRSAKSIAAGHHLDIDKVNTFIRGFSRRFEVYWKWRGRLEKQVDQNFYLRNPFGRRRWWYSRQVTEMYNFLPSSTAADMMYVTLIDVERELPDALRLTVHDAATICVPYDEAKQAYHALKALMQRTWDIIVEQCDNPRLVKHFYPNGWHCPVDIHIGRTWKEAKEGNADLEQRILGRSA